MNNRIEQMLGDDNHVEDEAIVALSQLARAHGAESRAADIIAQAVIIDRFRFSPALGWLRWDGRRWDTDDVAEPRVVEDVRQFIDGTERDYRVRATFAEANLDRLVNGLLSRLSDEDMVGPKGGQKPITKLFEEFGTEEEKAEFDQVNRDLLDARRQADMWLNLLSAGKISAITKLCRGMECVITRSTEFDAHPDLMNCMNGIVDLRTGELRESDPSMLMTHLAGGDYDPNATSPLWDKALEAVHPDCVEWLQTRVGQSATGHTPDDDVLIVAEGSGENGKSAVMAVFLRALGSYGRLISHRVLIAQPGQHPTELMDLRGLRFALLEETPEEGRLNTHQLKTTIGTPQITARKMRRDDVTFDTSHSLWVNTNFLPQVDTTDHGTWRRLKAMPWPFRFRKPGLPMESVNDRTGDLALKSKLKYDDGVPGAALAWIVKGAMRWYAAGMTSPADTSPVTAATSQWRQNSDIGYKFAAEGLVADPGYFISAEVMKAQFLDLLASEGKKPWSNQTINNRLPASMESAGIICDKTPQVTCKLSEAMQESRPPDEDRTRAQGNAHGYHGYPPSSPTCGKVIIEVGRNYRVWRGVRFKTKEELRAGHLTMVRTVAPTGDEFMAGGAPR